MPFFYHCWYQNPASLYCQSGNSKWHNDLSHVWKYCEIYIKVRVNLFWKQCFTQSSYKLSSADIIWRYHQIMSIEDCAKLCSIGKKMDINVWYLIQMYWFWSAKWYPPMKKNDGLRLVGARFKISLLSS